VAEAFLATVGRAIRRDPHAPPGARCAVEAMAAASGPFDAGMERELRLFKELAGSAEARAFRYGFLSDRRAGRVLGPKPAPVRAAAVIGAGTMGRGIALALVAAGIRTRLVESDPGRLALGIEAIAAELNRAAARGRISAAELGARLGLLTDTCSMSEIGDVDLVIEAIFEDLQVKRRLFAELDRVVRSDAVLASNTSSLDLNRIAEATEMPERVVGLHFFSPADRMRLVEIVEGRKTAPAVLARAAGLVRQLGKVGVIAQVGDGFIGNRIMDQYVRQAMLLLRSGATPGQIDDALESWGMAMGPFRVLDVVGNDIPWQARRARYGADPGGVEWELADELYSRGWLGRKSRRGWYDYPTTGPVVPNPELPPLIAECSGPVVRQPTATEIVERCVYAMVNEAAAVLADGVAAQSADIDVVFRNGYGFPAARGGPLFHADSVGLDRVVATMRRFAETDPFFEPHPLLVERARRDASLVEGMGNA
jgi:3-hydroxyacyl-CoA dehydrogenase